MPSVEHMLNYLYELDVGVLTDWENEFLNSIGEMDNEATLTPPQLAKLKEIYDAH